MGMAVKVKMLMAARGLTLSALGERMDPPTSGQNIGRKIRHDNLSENDLAAIAKACDARFEGVFVLNDTGMEIR